MHRIICGDGLYELSRLQADMYFCDPPDGIGLKYDGFEDKFNDYGRWLTGFISTALCQAPTLWLSFNSKWIIEVGFRVKRLVNIIDGLEVKPCVQTFTFGQHCHTDLGNGNRPLWRFRKWGAPLYPNQIRVPSWRQQNGDKRADPRGRVPLDVFDFPRVTGNSKQRRKWHPTQLHEGLVERCILMSTKEGDHVVDPFAGTGTTLRVCKRLNRRCTLIDISESYCQKIAEEHGLEVEYALV